MLIEFLDYSNKYTLSPLIRYSLIGLREHIKKRPPLATTEKVQQLVRVRLMIKSTSIKSLEYLFVPKYPTCSHVNRQ